MLMVLYWLVFVIWLVAFVRFVIAYRHAGKELKRFSQSIDDLSRNMDEVMMSGLVTREKTLLLDDLNTRCNALQDQSRKAHDIAKSKNKTANIWLAVLLLTFAAYALTW